MGEHPTRPMDDLTAFAQRPLDALDQQRADALKDNLDRSVDMIMQYWKLMQVELGPETPASVNDLSPNSPTRQERKMVTEFQREKISIRGHMAQLAEYIGFVAAEAHLASLLQKYSITYVTMADLLGPGAEPQSGNK